MADEKMVSRNLDTEEVETVVKEIKYQHTLEINYLNMSKIDTDPEMVKSWREDAYLANLSKIQQAKRLTPEQFINYKVLDYIHCSYSELKIPEWEKYK